jgi:hypothetical protein
MKKIDLEKSVFELTEEYPELIDILGELGFLGVKNQMVRNTLGRMTTIPQGCKKQGRDLDEIIERLKNEGFEIIS